jgi:hypothetical protein
MSSQAQRPVPSTLSAAVPSDVWWSQPLPVARYVLQAQVLQPLMLPPFAGSLLRGQFGSALRNLACTTGAPTCNQCPRAGTCTYARVFDGTLPTENPHVAKGFAQVPNPYVIRPPQPGPPLRAGDTFQWGLVLVGHAIDQLPLLATAWQLALAQGLGPQRAPARLIQVQWVDLMEQPHHIAAPGTSQGIAPHAGVLQVPPPQWQGGPIRLQLLTPLRLQQQSGLVGVQTLTAPLLLGAIARRAGLLLAMHGGVDGALPLAATAGHIAQSLHLQADLHWHDQTRFSARQRGEMTLGGLLGTITLHAPDAYTAHALWPWLWLGQWLHAGKNATMGLGGYQLVEGV